MCFQLPTHHTGCGHPRPTRDRPMTACEDAVRRASAFAEHFRLTGGEYIPGSSQGPRRTLCQPLDPEEEDVDNAVCEPCKADLKRACEALVWDWAMARRAEDGRKEWEEKEREMGKGKGKVEVRGLGWEREIPEEAVESDSSGELALFDLEIEEKTKGDPKRARRMGFSEER